MTEYVEQTISLSDNPTATTDPQTTDQPAVEPAAVTEQTTTETHEIQPMTVNEAASPEAGPSQSTPETDETPPVESTNPTEANKSPVRIYREETDAIEFQYPDGAVAAVSAHPPQIRLSETEGQLEEQTTSNVETCSTDGYARSDASIISVVEKVNPSSSALKTGQTTEDEVNKVDLSEEITEPIMHVADPCTEVPEPVGTPQTSRSKVSESRGGDNGPELNMARLVDAVEIREATVEDIPPTEPIVVEPVNHTDRPKRPPPPSVEKSTHQVVDSVEKSTKKTHGGFHFRFGGTKSRENSATREESPAHQNRRTLGENMRNAFGTLTRSIKKKHHSLEQKKRATLNASVDGRHTQAHAPGERIVVTVRSPSNGPDDQEEQSLQSVSGVCLSHESSVQGTPNQKRRQLIRSAAHDFQQALPIDDQMTDVTPIYVNHAMQPNYHSDQPNASPIEAETAVAVNAESSADKERVLNWTAASIANTGATYEDSIHEDEIQPVRVERGRTQQVFLSRLVMDDGNQPQPGASNTVRSPRRLLGDSPKPPRPVSRPVLSPLDYQTFHSEDSLAQPDVVTRRVDMIHAIAPTTEVTTSPGVPYQVTEEQKTDVHPELGQRDAYKVTASLDRRQYDSFERPRPTEMRRAQTMRTADYTSRIRQRLLTFRGDSMDKHDEVGGTLRVSKVRSKPENYVCSETIHFPKKFFKLKRRQTTTAAKQVHSTPNEPVIPRPQPRAMLSYQAPSPTLPRTPLQENIAVTHTIHVQGKPPRSAPAPRMQAMSGQITPELSMRSPRQLTSLQTLAASPKAQRCTAVPDSPQRGLIQMMDTALGSPKQMHDVTSFPYLSKELMVQVSQSDKGLKVDATTLQNYSDGPLIEASLKQVHPFLDHRGETTQEEQSKTPTDSADSKENTPCVKSCMQNFLNTCVRLKSVDLQGHYAAFHYPLRAFNSALWSSRALFVDWNNLHVIQEPGYITEYVELPPSHQVQGFMYADKPVDALLTNWLDCHQTTPPSDVGCHSPNASSDKTVHLYHPISFAVRLDQLLTHTEGTQNEEVYDTCFRLATLLSYAYCLKRLAHQNLPSNSITSDPKQILVILSTSNCLMLFKKPSAESAEPTTHSLVKSISPNHESIEQAVDALIQKLDAITKAALEKMDCSSRLLQAVAPPDWMAICCSRIYLKQQ